jgi:hypothetical protein
MDQSNTPSNTPAQPPANTPVQTFRDGRLKAVLWENQGADGPYHTVTLARTYEDKEGRLQDSSSFTRSELLRIAELAREAHSAMRDLGRERGDEREVAAPAPQQGNTRKEGRYR